MTVTRESIKPSDDSPDIRYIRRMVEDGGGTEHEEALLKAYDRAVREVERLHALHLQRTKLTHSAFTERDQLSARNEELQRRVDAMNNIHDQLPDPDQHPSDVQCDYRAWLNDLDTELSALAALPEDNDGSFGATVRRLREERKIGLRKFAEMVGMSPTYLSKVERDDFNPPSEEKVRAIAQALGQDADELLALAGRVSADLANIIQRHPREMATFLRAANGLSVEEMQRLAEEAQRLKKEEGT